MAALCGAGPRLTSEIDVTASHTELLVAEWGPDAPEDSLAKSIARGLFGTTPVIAGAGLTAPIAYRWKTQINENAKLPCFSHELPELDHNELVGWEGAPDRRPLLGGVPGRLRPAPAREGAHGIDRAADRPVCGVRVSPQTRGQTSVERVISLVLLGDLVSIYLAVLRRVDPVPVKAIDELKAALAGAVRTSSGGF